jgi:hypothetical protein
MRLDGYGCYSNLRNIKGRAKETSTNPWLPRMILYVSDLDAGFFPHLPGDGIFKGLGGLAKTGQS